MICEDSIFVDDVHIPSTIRYIGIDGIFSERLVIEGKDTYIGGLYLCYLNTIYIPCGTWAMYYSLIESNMIHSKEVQCGIEEYGFEDFKEKLRHWEAEYNNFPMKPLGWKSPNEKYEEYRAL